MKSVKMLFIFLVGTILLSSCGVPSGDCPDGEIKWMDMVMIENIRYQHPFPEPADELVPISIEKERKLGEVIYKMADSACSNHKMENGDATFLEEGTSIYEFKGYPTDLLVVANNDVYVAETNQKAKTAAELLPMRNAVKNIHVESTEDGSRIHTFSQPSTSIFLDAWDQLKLEDPQFLYEEGKMEGKRLFLEIELKNGFSFRLPYIKDSNTFSNGAIGNRKIKDTIEHEASDVKDEYLFTE